MPRGDSVSNVGSTRGNLAGGAAAPATPAPAGDADVAAAADVAGAVVKADNAASASWSNLAGSILWQQISKVLSQR